MSRNHGATSLNRGLLRLDGRTAQSSAETGATAGAAAWGANLGCRIINHYKIFQGGQIVDWMPVPECEIILHPVIEPTQRSMSLTHSPAVRGQGDWLSVGSGTHFSLGKQGRITSTGIPHSADQDGRVPRRELEYDGLTKAA